ncbi:hypothetical protein CR513_57377, partial [Mucuna pruriens]
MFLVRLIIVESINFWHGQRGHVNIACIKQLCSINLLPHIKEDLIFKCHVYTEAKHTKPPFKPVTVREIKLLKLVHFDLANYKKYNKTKDEIKFLSIKYKAEIENQLNKNIKRLGSNKCDEYIIITLKDFMKRMTYTCVYCILYTTTKWNSRKKKLGHSRI